MSDVIRTGAAMRRRERRLRSSFGTNAEEKERDRVKREQERAEIDAWVRQTQERVLEFPKKKEEEKQEQEVAEVFLSFLWLCPCCSLLEIWTFFLGPLFLLLRVS